MATEVPEPIVPEIHTQTQPVRARQVAPLGSVLIVLAGLLMVLVAWLLHSESERLLGDAYKRGREAGRGVGRVPGRRESYWLDPGQVKGRQEQAQRAIARARRAANVQFYGMYAQGAMLVVVAVGLFGFRVVVASDDDTRLRATERVFYAFALLLVAGIAPIALVYYEQLAAEGAMPASKVLAYLGGMESFYTVVVLLALAWISCPRPRAGLKPERRLIVWLVSVTIAFGMVGLGVVYELFIHKTFHIPVEGIEQLVKQDTSLLPLWIIVICVQPPVIEELFFRHLMLDAFRGVMGKHGAVFLTALLFAMAHVGAPLVVPLVFLFGVFLGYARVISGGIALPIVMHFLYNSGVFYIALSKYPGLL